MCRIAFQVVILGSAHLGEEILAFHEKKSPVKKRFLYISLPKKTDKREAK